MSTDTAIADTAIADIDGVAMVVLDAAGEVDVEIAFEEEGSPEDNNKKAGSATATPATGATSAASTTTSKPHSPTKKTGWFNKSLRSFKKTVSTIGGTHEDTGGTCQSKAMISSVVLAIVIGAYAMFLAVAGEFFDTLSPYDAGVSTSESYLELSPVTKGVTGAICGVLCVFALYTICRVTCCRRRTLESFKTEYETRGGSKWRIVRAYQLFQWAKGPNSPEWAEFTIAKEGIETGLQIINVVGCVGEKRHRAPACNLESTLGREERMKGHQN